MALQHNFKNNEIIEKDVHCPYCESDHAILFSRTASRRVSVQLPAYGLRFILSLLYLSVLHILRYGFKTVETIVNYDNITYVFCPYCGNTYSMAPPDVIKEETHDPRFYRVKDRKVIMGMCTGISEYTGIPLLWVRIMTFIYGLTVIGAILYFFVGACVPYKENAENGIHRGKLYRVEKGKDITGLCKGLSEYTDIPIGWVRFFMLLFAVTIVGIIVYFIVSAFVPVKEDIEAGKIRKKLYKVKHKKVLFGLCAGFSEYSGMPLWAARLIAILIFPIYFIFAAIIPTKEDEDVE